MRATGGAAQRPTPGHRCATPAPARWSAIPGLRRGRRCRRTRCQPAHRPRRRRGSRREPAATGAWPGARAPERVSFSASSHSISAPSAQPPRVASLIVRTASSTPAQREIAVGKVLAPGPGIEPRLAFAGARQGQILLQRDDPLDLIVTGLPHPVHDLLDALLQRRRQPRRAPGFLLCHPATERGRHAHHRSEPSLGGWRIRGALRYRPAGRRWLRRWPAGQGQRW